MTTATWYVLIGKCPSWALRLVDACVDTWREIRS